MMEVKKDEINLRKQKKAITEHPVMDLIKTRWSPRSFSPVAISQKDLNTLFEAAAWAPSSRNEQPWTYLYAIKGDEKYQDFVQCLMPGNEPWARNAAALVISMARKTFAKNQKTNRTFMHDTGLANMQLILQAHSMDIYGHMMAGFDMEKTRKIFQIPDDLEVICFIALGYLDSPDKLDEPYKTRELNERKRQPVSEFVFHESLK